MKILQQTFVVGFLLLVFAGCGSNNGGDYYNGDLTVVPAQAGSNASFTIQYTKSGVSNYAGLGCKIHTTINGVLVDSTPVTFSSSGILVKSYDSLNPLDYVRLEAQVGDIVRSASVTIKASDLTLTPTSISIAGLAPKVESPAITINGGVTPYSIVSGNSAVGWTKTSVNTFTVHKTDSTTGTTTVTVSDSSSPIKTATLTVTY